MKQSKNEKRQMRFRKELNEAIAKCIENEEKFSDNKRILSLSKKIDQDMILHILKNNKADNY